MALALLTILVAVFAAFDSDFAAPNSLTWSGLIRTLTLTHAWSIPIARTWNIVSWSISCEWAAYLSFPLIALAASRVRLGLGAFALTLGLFALLAFFILGSDYANSMAYGMPRIAVEFTAGVLLHRLWELQGFAKSARSDWIAIAALIILIAGGNLMATHTNAYVTLVYMPVFAAAVVYGLGSGNGILSRTLSSRVAQWCGHVSYAFYMVHGFIMNLTNRILGAFELTASTAWVVTTVLATLLLTTAVAACIYFWIETPARRAMVNWSARFAGANSRRLPALD